jgi:hypothetical protein
MRSLLAGVASSDRRARGVDIVPLLVIVVR